MNCTLASAPLYDLEFFRNGYHEATEAERLLLMADDPVARQYPGSSLIIDYDPAVLRDPPPGLRTEK